MEAQELIVEPKENEVKIVSRASDLLEMANRAVIDSADAQSRGVTLCQFIRDGLRLVESERTAITKPLNDVLKNINARFARPKTVLEEAKQVIDAKMLAYDRAEKEKARKAAEEAERIRKEEEAKARKEAEALEAAGRKAEAERVIQEVESRPAPTAIKTTPAVSSMGDSTASTIEIWQYEVTDFSKVPDQYKKLAE